MTTQSDMMRETTYEGNFLLQVASTSIRVHLNNSGNTDDISGNDKGKEEDDESLIFIQERGHQRHNIKDIAATEHNATTNASQHQDETPHHQEQYLKHEDETPHHQEHHVKHAQAAPAKKAPEHHTDDHQKHQKHEAPKGEHPGPTHGEHHDHVHGGAHGGHKMDPTDVAIAATLSCTILFIMGLFYLLNHPREQMRRYAYETVNATISIFSGILLFQGCHDVLETYVTRDMHLGFQFLANLLHMLIWLTVMQLTLALFAGILGPNIHKPRSFTSMMLNIKCWGVLLSHITGFASLNAWGTLQQARFFQTRSMVIEFLVVPVAAVFLMITEKITKSIRLWVALRDDQKQDRYEAAWDEETQEAENEVMGFTVSFLVIQVFRGVISGVMPTPDGEELSRTVSRHNTVQVLQLLGVAVVCVLSIIVVMHGKMHRGWTGRFFLSMVTATCMGFAWSIFFASMWYLGQFPFLANSIILLSVVQAVSLSVASFITIFILDWLAEKDWTVEEVDKDIEKIIVGIGMLVGFSWEQCFHHATHAVSHSMHMAATGKLMLSIVCLVIIVPAWRFYMLPMVIHEGWRFGFVPNEANMQKAMDHLKVHSFED